MNFPPHFQGSEEDAQYMSVLAADARKTRGLQDMKIHPAMDEDLLTQWTVYQRHLY